MWPKPSRYDRILILFHFTHACLVLLLVAVCCLLLLPERVAPPYTLNRVVKPCWFLHLVEYLQRQPHPSNQIIHSTNSLTCAPKLMSNKSAHMSWLVGSTWHCGSFFFFGVPSLHAQPPHSSPRFGGNFH